MSNKRSSKGPLCNFQFADGRHCALPAHPEGQGFCLTHFRYRHRAVPPEPAEQDLSAELCSPAGDYITNIDINHVIGKLYEALAANRISPRRATSLAYVASLLMQSQAGAKREAWRWDLDYSIFRRLLQLKYPKGHPNRPKPHPVPTPPADPSALPDTDNPSVSAHQPNPRASANSDSPSSAVPPAGNSLHIV